MGRLGKGLLLGIGLWLAALGQPARAQTILITPQTGGGYGGYGGYGPAFGGQNLNPLLIGRQGNFFYGYGMPGVSLGPQQQAYQAAQAFQPGTTPPPVPTTGPSTGLPPFSTVPPPRYFFNYQPFYPLIRPGGVSGYIPQVGSPGG